MVPYLAIPVSRRTGLATDDILGRPPRLGRLHPDWRLVETEGVAWLGRRPLQPITYSSCVGCGLRSLFALPYGDLLANLRLAWPHFILLPPRLWALVGLVGISVKGALIVIVPLK